MGFKCFLLGHRSDVQKDDKTTICKRCGYKQLWRKGYAEYGLHFTRGTNGVLGVITNPMLWIPIFVLGLAIKLLIDII